jgi:hypothetical protein
VLCEYHNKFLRVQVKGTGAPRIKKGRKINHYQFSLHRISPEDSDLVALVCTDLKTIHYYLPESFKPQQQTATLTIRAAQNHNDDVLLGYLKKFSGL